MAITVGAIVVLIASAVRALVRERRTAGVLLGGALCATALLEFFDFCAVAGFAPAVSWKTCSLFVEALLPAAWLLCSLSYARAGGARDFSLPAKILVSCSLLLLVVPLAFPLRAFFYAPDFPAEPLLFLSDLGCYYYVAVMALLVLALINFETTLVSASPEALWRVKLDVIALGSMAGILVFYFSQALLYRTLDMDYLPLRSTVFAAGAALMSYSRLRSRGPVRIKVSQHAALKSVVFAVVASYLVLLGMLGMGMQYLGAFFPRTLTVAVGFLAGMLLLVLLFSDRLKREVKVFLHKHFYQSKYDYRAQWLSLTQRLACAGSSEELLASLLEAYCETFGVQGAALFLYQEGCGWYCTSSIRQMEAVTETLAADNLLVEYLERRRWVFSVRDQNPLIQQENALFLERHQISFVIPLFERDGLIGFIALGALVKKDEPFIYEDFDLMKAMARQASLAIQHQRLSEQLTQARAVEAVGSLATFVVHDLKNQVATVSLILENARRHLDNPEFQQDMLGSLGNTVQKMQRLISRLRNLGESEMLQIQPVDLLDLVQKSARQVGSGRVTVSGTHQLALADVTEMQKVVLNLLLNGIEASPAEEPIGAEVGFEGAPFIRVCDAGCGMTPGFLRSELFTPFRTTKKQGLGVGLYQCRQIVEAHGGRIDVSSVQGKGTVFTVWLKAAGGGQCETVAA